jgi:hypothetical protein
MLHNCLNKGTETAYSIQRRPVGLQYITIPQKYRRNSVSAMRSSHQLVSVSALQRDGFLCISGCTRNAANLLRSGAELVRAQRGRRRSMGAAAAGNNRTQSLGLFIEMTHSNQRGQPPFTQEPMGFQEDGGGTGALTHPRLT